MIAIRTAASAAVLIASLALVLLPIGLGAQALEPGARVRLTQSSGARHQGILQTIEPDSARLTGTRGQSVAVSLASVERVEVSRGRQRQFWRNFGLTTMASAVAGGGIGAATWTPCEEDGWFSCMFVPESRSQAMLAGAVVGGLVGIPIGVVVGAAVRQEQWAPVQHEGVRPRQVSIRPSFVGGVGFAAELTFE